MVHSLKMKLASGGCALIAILALGSCATETASPLKETAARAVKHPHWISVPTGDDLKRLYPPEAARLRLAGEATMKCNIDIEGRLQGCAIIAETPPGKGFGASTLALAPTFRLGDANGGVIQIPLHWEYGWH